MVNFGEVWRAQSARSILLTSTMGPLGSFQNFKVCSDGKEREWGAEYNRKLLHLFIPSKIAALVPEFAMEVLPLDRTATLVPAFTVEDVPLGRTL